MNKKQQLNGLWKAAAVSAGISLLVSFAGCLLMAWMVESQKMDIETVRYGIMAVTALSSVLGSIIARNSFGQKALIICGVTSLMYYLVLLGLGALFFEGGMQGYLETLLLILGTGLAVAFMGLNGKQKKHAVKYRTSNG